MKSNYLILIKMVRPRIYSSSDDETYDVDKAKRLRYYQKNKDVENVKRQIRRYKQLLNNNELTEDKRKKYEMKLFELNERLKII